jgi:ribosomal protein L16/L10AE
MGVAEIVVAVLGIVAAIAPGVLAAITGSGSDAEAIEAARKAAEKIPDRTEQGARDLEDRKRRGHPTLTDE